MKVAVLSYPMLFQRIGGLQVQVLETVRHLRDRGIDARLMNPLEEKLADYDLVHIFSAINGVHRMAQSAKDAGRPLVVSSVLHGQASASSAFRAKLASMLTSRITRWDVTTSYDQIGVTLNLADRIIALGQNEIGLLQRMYDQPAAKTRIIPNGISQRFFQSDPHAFTEKFGLEPGFILCVASVSPYKNQLGLVRAAKDLGRRIVLIGPVAQENQAYLEQCRREGGETVHYAGVLAYDDPLLPSAYAAAGLTVLASQTEVMPLVVLESLAAGTPAVVTQNQSLGLAAPAPLYAEIDPANGGAITAAARAALDGNVRPQDCKNAVAHLTWEQVATDIAGIYDSLLK